MTSPILRLPRTLYQEMKLDLQRPHAFAYERVAFLYARPGAPAMAFAYAYEPVDDEHYIKDNTVGARIGRDAIRRAMQVAHARRDCVFHAHMHGGTGEVGFSGVDIEELGRLIPPFLHLVPGSMHGAIVLNEDSAAGLLWINAAAAPTPLTTFVVVGYPTIIWRKP